ncbi:MAG TPA: DUF1257 domain-containing protein [Tepidisphaeraceae bacterium]|jgi:hypothetical protein|nr:DUF1257 domain-containing protein [Tepidisphaeraceae bacterium]
MGAIVVITPLIIAGWPAITAAVTAAVGSLGFTLAQGAAANIQRADTTTRCEVDIEDSQILESSAGSGEELVVVKDSIRAVFSRDARGALKLSLEGKNISKAELKQLGDELVGRVTQQYAYHRIITELKSRNMAIVEEQVQADRTVKIQVRSI